MVRCCLVLLTLLSASGIARAETLTVLAMPLSGKGADQVSVSRFNELTPMALSAVRGFKVATLADIQAQLDQERLKDLLGCSDVLCAAGDGGALGSIYIVTGSITKIAGELIVTLNVIDTRSQSTRRGQVTVRDEPSMYRAAVSMALARALEPSASCAMDEVLGCQILCVPRRPRELLAVGQVGDAAA